MQNIKRKFTHHKTPLKGVDENQEDHSNNHAVPNHTSHHPSFLSSHKHSYTHDNNKVSIGDKVKINTNKHANLKGTVMYIGYPFPSKTARFGINLEKAKGEHNGSLMFDIKTEKIITKTSHLKKYKKRIKKRNFFKAKSKHGIFVKRNEIISIERLSTSSQRFTIEDTVTVRFRGNGMIKFIGNLENSKATGVWYGIELNERRGRHDGTVNGVKYFQCSPQYGLHARQTHLTLIETSNSVALKGGDSYLNANAPQKRRESIGENQKSAKWAKVLGFKPAQASMVNLTDPNFKHHHHVQSSTFQTATIKTNTSYLSLKLAGPTTVSSLNLPNKVPTLDTLNVSLSNMLPQQMNFTNNFSVQVLPGMYKKKTASQTSHKKVKTHLDHQQSATVSVHDSVKRGGTLAVLPGYSVRFKNKKFFDYFDFDEIEDELGEGEFGVVYKCRRVDIEEEDDEYEFSTTIKTAYGSMTNTVTVYPGDKIDEEGSVSDESLSYSSSESDAEDGYFAVKKIKKAKFHHLNYQHKQESIKLLQQEIKLLEKINHLKKRKMEGSQYIVDLVDVFEDRNYLYIVTNFCSGGNLWQFIEESESFSEEKIQTIMKQILEGLSFLHRHKIAHLDLKPDNIMFDGANEIQLIDFGMSRMIPPLHKAGVLVGTPNFVAPEVIQGFYDKKADVWSVGIIFFMLRFGYPPFFEGASFEMKHKSMDETDEEKHQNEHGMLFEKIKNGFDPSVKPGLGAWFPSEITVSDELKDLISKMLSSDLAKRLTTAECLGHPYFKTLADAKRLPPTVMDALTKFNGQCQFNVMIARLFAHQIEPEQEKQLRECWNKFDVDNDGSLTLAQFKAVMNEYDHGYKDYQIEAIFESLDWNETDRINFNSLLTAFSYQRLVAVDERLWEAFARLDVDNDGHITKAEIKRVLALVNPEAFDDGLKHLSLFTPVNDSEFSEMKTENESSRKLSAQERRQKNISLWIGDCMISADWDDDGQIDYEEFLRSLHPRFNETPVTPKALRSISNYDSSEKLTSAKFIFQPSLGTGMKYGKNGGNITPVITPIDDKTQTTDEVGKASFNAYLKSKQKSED